MSRRITTAAICLIAAATAGAQTTSKPAAQSAAKPVTHAVVAHTTSVPKKETQAQLRKEAKIRMSAARATALKEVPNGRVQTAQLERENGSLVYSFDIKVPGKAGIEEVNVDAATGSVASHEHATSKMEAKEKKEAKH